MWQDACRAGHPYECPALGCDRKFSTQRGAATHHRLTHENVPEPKQVRHGVMLIRVEYDTTLTDYEVEDALNLLLGVVEEPIVDLSAVKFTRAADVTPPRGID